MIMQATDAPVWPNMEGLEAVETPSVVIRLDPKTTYYMREVYQLAGTKTHMVERIISPTPFLRGRGVVMFTGPALYLQLPLMTAAQAGKSTKRNHNKLTDRWGRLK